MSAATRLVETGMCPSCGHNLTADRPVVLGDWMVATSFVMHGNRQFALSPMQSSILHSLARAGGRPVSYSVLADRAGVEGYCALKVHIANIRAKVPGVPIIAERGVGYRWDTRFAEVSPAEDADWLSNELARVEAEFRRRHAHV